MPVYQYKALDEGGKPAGGVIDADTPKEARLKLRERKLRVTELAPIAKGVSAAAEGPAKGLRVWIPRGRRVQEISLLTRQLGTLLSSGVPIMTALNALIEQSESNAMKSVLMTVREKVAQGATLSDALALYPGLFSELYVNMVRAGEASGALDKVLFRLADYLASQNRIQSRISAALTYPTIIVILGVCVVSFLLATVVPRLTAIFEARRIPLPMPTQVLIGVSKVFSHYWWALLIVAIASWVAFLAVLRTEGGRLWWDTLMLRMPILGSLFRKAAISRFAITFATLVESGLPVLDSMSIVAQVVGNRRIGKALEEARRKIAEGSDIASPLKSSGVFPATVTYMIAVGEESGKLEDLLRRVSEAYDEEIEVAAQKMTAALEPLLIVAMAVFVGFIVFSVLMPIMQMAKI